jgi:hypothetical protein
MQSNKMLGFHAEALGNREMTGRIGRDPPV